MLRKSTCIQYKYVNSSLVVGCVYYISGRLTDPSPGSSSTCGLESSEPLCISPQSWYACKCSSIFAPLDGCKVFSHYATFSLGVNYYMSVLPFLAAVQTGVVVKGEVQLHIQVPAEAAQEYCSSFTDCSNKYPDAMTKWETFFQVSFLLSIDAHLG